jgi:MFS transporter, PHS family, inorganic phosphate transporter
MSTSVTSDHTKIQKCGTMPVFIFANQGWGSLVGLLVTIIVLSIYKPVMHNKGNTSKIDGGEPSFWFFIHRLWWRVCV